MKSIRVLLVCERTQSAFDWLDGAIFQDGSRVLLDRAHDPCAAATSLAQMRHIHAYRVVLIDQPPFGFDRVLALVAGLIRSDPECDMVVTGAGADLVAWKQALATLPTRPFVFKGRPEPFELEQLMISRWESTDKREAAGVDVARAGAMSQTAHSRQLAAIGHLAAGLAHEIGTPVQYASDSAYFLQSLWEEFKGHLYADSDSDESAIPDSLLVEVPQALERLNTGLHRVAEILVAMRELAPRNEEEDFRPEDINRGLKNALLLTEGMASGIKISAELAQLPRVRCKAGAVINVFTNLLVNAIHAIEDSGRGSGGRILVSTRQEEAYAVIEVRDNGTGIDPSIEDKIYDPFFTTKEVGRGTGQGLAIASSIVAEHQGEIQYETGHFGTTFYIYLPISGPAFRGVAT